MYDKIDQEQILKLFKIVSPTSQDIDSLWNLHKKYINVNSPRPISNCGTCGNSVTGYWRDLQKWYSENGNKF